MQSVVCQEKAWKATHKSECAYIDLPSLAPQGSGQMVAAAMRAFAAKHLKTIQSIALDALDVDSDPERGFRDALVIRLKPQPEPMLVENMFQATDVRIYSKYEMGDRARSQEIFDHLKAGIARRESGRRDATHGVNVILLNTNPKVIDILPVVFSERQIHFPANFGPEYAGLEWDQVLLALLNKVS